MCSILIVFSADTNTLFIWKFSTGHMQWWKLLFAFPFDLFWKTRSIFLDYDCLWAATLCAVCVVLFLFQLVGVVVTFFKKAKIPKWNIYSNADLIRFVSNFGQQLNNATAAIASMATTILTIIIFVAFVGRSDIVCF